MAALRTVVADDAGLLHGAYRHDRAGVVGAALAAVRSIAMLNPGLEVQLPTVLSYDRL